MPRKPSGKDKQAEIASAETEVAATAATPAEIAATAATPAEIAATAATPAEIAPTMATPAEIAPTMASGADDPHLAAPRLPVIERDTYEILGEHDRGGLGRVLKARDTRTGRIVAIKELLDDAPHAARFQREALVTANLQHPSIVPVYEVGRWTDGCVFYAMKLVSGHALSTEIARACDRRERLALLPHVIRVADALAYAHERGIIHRDLKPANVLVGSFGETVVIDWGLAKDLLGADDDPSTAGLDLASSVGDLTMAGALLGTPAYMPPEQARGDDVDERADVYAIGAMLYHVLSGTMPYADATSVEEIIERVKLAPPRSLAEIDSGLPPDLVAIVDKAMAPRDERYRSARELSEDLLRFETGKLVSVHSYSTRELLARFVARNRVALAVVALAAAALVGVGVYSYARVKGERDVAREQRSVADEQRARAESALDTASRSLASLHGELGRRELDNGNEMRALAHLVESARRSGAIDSGLAHLVGRATRPLEPLVWTRAAHSGTAYVSASGDLALSTDNHESIRLWNPGTGEPGGSIRLSEQTELAMAVGDGAWVVAVSPHLTMWRSDHLEAPAVRIERDDKAAFVRAVRASDGSIVTGDLAGQLAVWKLGSEQPTRTWQAATGPVTVTAALPDQRVLSVGADGTAAIWDTRSGTVRVRLQGRVRPTMTPTLAVDGSRLLVLDAASRHVVVYDVATGKPVLTLAFPGSDPKAEFLDATISPDGRRIVTVGGEQETMLWDGVSGAPITTMHERRSRGTGGVIAFIDSRRLAATAAPGELEVWSADSGELLTRLVGLSGIVSTAQAIDDGERLLAGDSAGAVGVWDLAAPVAQATLSGHTDQTRRVLYAGDGRRAVTASRDGSLAVWDTSTGQRLWTRAGVHTVIRAVDVSPDGRRAVTWGDDGAVRVTELSGDAPPLTLAELQGRVDGLAWLDDDRVATGSADGVFRVWKVSDQSKLCESEAIGGPLFGLSASPDRQLVVGNAEGPVSGVWRAADCALVYRIETGHEISWHVRWFPDSTRVLVAGSVPYESDPSNAKPALVVADTSSKRLRPIATDPRSFVTSIAVAPDGSRIATGDSSGRVRVLDAGNYDELVGTTASDSSIVSLAFDGSGQLVVAGEDAGPIRVFEARTGRLLSTYSGHRTGVYWMRMRGDGRQFATAALSPAPRLWSLPSYSGSVEELIALATCRGTWRVSGAALVETQPDPTACETQ